ncbi:MAG: 23S rRNA (guanosine(2251)-2'-O)-methyltransferase RlmB [Desulfobacterales bacterium]|jgi:23S rRNA (guanosine2251-2'-O)-methyltransferase|nr:23S rRNA (guanosine(2251)-2'-O)-methyltransferase RlmB [Desulfobacterales bacterium]
MKTELLYGHHPVREALKASRRKIHLLYLSREAASSHAILALAEQQHIPVERVTGDKIQSLTRTDKHQGLCAVVDGFPLTSDTELFNTMSQTGKPAFFLVIDGVLDPHNLGALIRSALAVGVGMVITPQDRSVPPTAAVSKASAGALEHIRLARVTNLSRTIDALKEKGLWVFGLDRAAARQLYDTDMTVPTALVVGGEEKGIRPLVKKHCDGLVSIPQLGPLNSLNASVAGAVAMYEVLRQRNRSTPYQQNEKTLYSAKGDA